MMTEVGCNVHGSAATHVVNQLRGRQEGIWHYDLLAIDSSERSGKEAKLLDIKILIVDHHQIPHVKHVCREDEDKLATGSAIDFHPREASYRFEQRLG